MPLLALLLGSRSSLGSGFFLSGSGGGLDCLGFGSSLGGLLCSSSLGLRGRFLSLGSSTLAIGSKSFRLGFILLQASTQAAYLVVLHSQLVAHIGNLGIETVELIALHIIGIEVTHALEEIAQDQSYGLVIIDGIRDLLLDINNAGESVEVINKMMEWSSKYDLHIHCVLHQNKGDNNVRGHIGTEMNNKAETVLVITKSTTNPDISEVKAMHIREKEFKPFAFTVNEEGLPEIVEHTPEKEEGDKQPSRFTYQDLTSEQHNEALTAAFKEKPIKGFDRMVEELTQAYADIGFKRGRSVIIKMLKYLINEQKLIVKRDNHYYFGYTPAEIDLFHEEE